LTLKTAYTPGRYNLINDGSNSVEDRLGAIGDMNLAIKSTPIDDDLLVIGGDNLFDFNLNDFVRFSYNNRPYHSMCLYLPGNHIDITKYGVAQLNENSLITGLKKNPSFLNPI